MRTIEEYTSGRVLEDTKRKEMMVDKIRKDPQGEKELKEELMAIAEDARNRHRLATMQELEKLIRNASSVAVGPRICLERHQECEKPAMSVFLDGLAQGLMKNGKAEEVSPEGAIEILKQGKRNGHPHVVSYIEGKPMEICNTCIKCCVLWQLESIGINCISK